MKNIKTYNNFINESLKDKLKGKSESEILNNVKNLSPEEKLKKGAKYGFLSLIKKAIEEGVDPSIVDNYAIRYASVKGHLDVVKELLKDKRVDPSDYSNEAIRAASEKGHLDIVKELLKDKRVDPSDVDNWAIIYASERGHLDIVEELLKDERVDPSDENNFAIMDASRNGHLDVVKELLKDERVLNKLSVEMLNKYRKLLSNLNESLKDKLKGKSESEILNNVKDLSPIEKLEKGVRYGILSLVKKSIEEGVDPSSGDNYAIRYASVNGHLDVVKELLKDDRVDPSDDNNYSIKIASYYGHLDIVKELLKDKRVDPSDNYNAPIIYASEYGHLDVVKYLLKDDRVDPSDDNNYSIKIASYYGHLDIVKELLKDERVKNKLNKKELNRYKEQVSDLNESLKDKLKGKSESEILDKVKDLYPIEKLEKGVNYGILPLVKQAIEEGVDPSNGDNYAIRFASKNGYTDIVKYLLKDERVDPSDYSNNPIRISSRKGHLNVVKELLKDERVDPSVQSNFAIMSASKNGHLDVVKELLKDERVKNKLNKKYLERYKNQISSLNESLKDSLNNKLDYIKLLDKVENILETIKDKEYIEFNINKIYLYGGVLKKGFENTKDIDIFVEVSNYKSYSDKIDDNISDFKEFLHEIPENEYGHDFMIFNDKFLDINFTDYDFEFDFDEDEPRIELYDFYYNNK